MMKKIVAVLLAFMLLSVQSVLAASYTAPVYVTESGGNTYTSLPLMFMVDNDYLADNGFITSMGLDTQVSASVETTATTYLHMLADDRVLFVADVTADSQTAYSYDTNQGPLTDFPIIVGYGGYITTADNVALEPGDTFELTYDGYIETSAGVSKYLANKEGAFSLYVSGEGEITASIICENTNFPAYEGYDTDYSSSAASTSVDIPACSSGDYLVMLVDADTTPSLPEGWSTLTSSGGYYIFYKVAGEAEGSSITVTFGDSYTKAVYMTYCISGADGIEVSSVATGSSTTPDPPSFTPTHGLGNYLWLPSGSIHRETTLSSGPSGYSNSRYFGDLNYYGVYAATKTSAASTEDPGVFTLGYSESWVTYTTALYSSAVTFDLTASSVTSGEHTVKVLADSTNLYLYIDDVLEDSAALGGNSILDNSSNFEFMKNNVSPYINYISYSVSGTPQLKYEPITMISGTTLVDEVNSFNGVITWGSNPAGVALTVGALLPPTDELIAPGDVNDVPDFMPDTSELDEFTNDGVEGTHLPFYQIFKVGLGNWAAMGGPTISMPYFWKLAALVIAWVLGTGILIASRQVVVGLIAYAVGFIVPSVALGGVLDLWIPTVYIIGAVALSLLVSKWGQSSL